MKSKVAVHKLYIFLKEAMPILIFLMLMFFGAAILGFQSDNRALLQDTKSIVSKQDLTLSAIEALARDTKIESKQKTDIIICMLQVPVGERTTETVANCRKSVESRSTTESQPHATSNENSSNQAQATQPSSPAQTPPTSTPPTQNKSVVQKFGERITNVSDKFKRVIDRIL